VAAAKCDEAHGVGLARREMRCHYRLSTWNAAAWSTLHLTLDIIDVMGCLFLIGWPNRNIEDINNEQVLFLTSFCLGWNEPYI
jgi:hypothetical protein